MSRKQKQRTIYLMFTLSERQVTSYHYNDTRSTVARWSFHNDQRHVTAFRPISEAAHSRSYDKSHFRSVQPNTVNDITRIALRVSNNNVQGESNCPQTPEVYHQDKTDGKS